MFKILSRLKVKEWIYVLLGIIFIVGQVWLDLKLPDFMNAITTIVTTGEGTTAELWGNGGLMVVCALSSALLAIFTGYLAAKIAAGLSQTLRSDVFRKINNLSDEEVKKFSIPSLITRSTNDIVGIQNFVAMGLQVLIKAPILAVWAIVKIMGISWQWSTATALAVVTLVIVIGILVAVTMPRFRKIQKLTDNLNDVTRENITGIRVVRAYNAENYEKNKFEKANNDLVKNYLVTGRAMALMPAMMSFVMSGLSLAIYIIGALLINNFSLTGNTLLDIPAIAARGKLFADMVTFSGYAMQVVMAFVMMTMIFIMLPRAVVSAKRINEVLDVPFTIVDGKGVEQTNRTGEIEFKHVSFKYPDAADYVIQNVNLKINKGETVAFIGSTGSGKTTLVNLVPRFYDATEGEVLVNGVNVKEYKLEDLNNKIGYVPQKPVLFSGDIKGNIDFGKDGKEQKNDDEINEALKVAQAGDFVSKVGLDAKVAQGGTNFSGGQKQRLCIARALARKPEFYIFDDSFSALDYKTDRNLRKELNKITKKSGSTVLIIAQRIGTIKEADKIVVFDDGKVAGVGTHSELLKSCKIYQEIVNSQFSKEEIE